MPGRQSKLPAASSRVTPASGNSPDARAVTGSRHLCGSGARLQADPARVPPEQQPIGARRRERLDRDPALRVLAHGTGRHEALVAGQPGQGRLPPADQDRQPGLPEPHITDPEAVRLQALSLPPRLDHPRHLVAEPPAQPMHQPAPSPPPAGRPTTAARPAPSPRRHPAPRHPVLRPSDSRSSRSPRPCWPGPRARGSPPPTQPPEPATAVEADVPGDRPHLTLSDLTTAGQNRMASSWRLATGEAPTDLAAQPDLRAKVPHFGTSIWAPGRAPAEVRAVRLVRDRARFPLEGESRSEGCRLLTPLHHVGEDQGNPPVDGDPPRGPRRTPAQ